MEGLIIIESLFYKYISKILCFKENLKGCRMNILSKMVKYFIISSVLILLAACTSTKDDAAKDTTLTQANVQLNLKKGETSQADVLGAFGAPNIITTDGAGDEVWSYQKNSMTATSSADGYYATIILAGINSGSGKYNQSTKTATLIIKFDQNKKVKDFKFMSANF
jgi:outer membrane protein assembly factor BamE (lipoprotein component of BamABCDE complex)